MGKKYTWGLVLSGGGARGFAHAGALKAIEEANIRPEVISGTSAGSIVGALYAAGYSPDQILGFFLKKKIRDFIRFTIPKLGIFQTKGLEKLLKKYLSDRTFDNLDKKFYTNALDFVNGKNVVFQSGNLVKTVLASSAIPVLFTPVEIDGVRYVDGGVMDNFPVDPIVDDCEKIIGIDVSPVGKVDDIKNLFILAERTFILTINRETKQKSKRCDIFISPENIHNYHALKLKEGEKIFNIGYEEAKKVLKSRNIKA